VQTFYETRTTSSAYAESVNRRVSLTFATIGAIACVVGAILFELLFPARGATTPETRASSVALLIDTSGSMADDNKIEEVKRAASEYVRRQQGAVGIAGVAVVRFSSGADTVSPLSTNTEAHLSAISRLRASGATEMVDGLQEAARALGGTESGVARTILLFTDGEPGSNIEDAEIAKARTLQAAQALRAQGLRLVAVGTADANIDFLGQVTGNLGLVFPTSAGNFSEAFQRADRAIKQLFSGGGNTSRGFVDALVLGALVTLALGSALLVAENMLGLRGRWWRDLGWVAPMSAVLGIGGALLGQGIFALLPDAPSSRAVAWAVVGAIAGGVLGLAERSRAKALRGTLGGAVGGYLGGFVFSVLTGTFSGGVLELISRLLGFAVLGFAIGLMLQLVQQALKTAWLTGITTGPYEGKQYILGKPVVTVGRSDGNDIGLYREKTLALNVGAFQFQTGRWQYRGNPIEINDALTNEATLSSGDTVKLGGTSFIFEERGKNNTPEPTSSAPESPEPEPVAPALNTPEPVSSAPVPQVEPAPQPVVVPPPAKRWRLFGEELLELPTGRVTVGRNDDNRLVLANVSISGHHALLEVLPNALFVTDLGSTNGTLLNDQPLPEGTPTPVNEGDRLTFGALQFRVMN
jgi:uncharacterized protein YegL